MKNKEFKNFTELTICDAAPTKINMICNKITDMLHTDQTIEDITIDHISTTCFGNDAREYVLIVVQYTVYRKEDSENDL